MREENPFVIRHLAFIRSPSFVIRYSLLWFFWMPLMFGCDNFFYYPNTVQYASPEEYRLEYESVMFRSQDGTRLHGWFFPAAVAVRTPAADGARADATGGLDGGAAGAGAPNAWGTVLHLHGNAGNITGHFPHVSWLPAAGWNVFCFDYRGYGRSEGRVSRAGTIADAHAALDHLLSRPEVNPAAVVAFGQSLGGAIGVVLAADRPEVRGLAVDGAFDSYRRIASWHVRRNPLLLCTVWWYPRLAIRSDHDPIDVIERISPRPVFIMHGTADRVVNPAMARRLFDAAGEPKELWLVEGADHYGAMQEHATEAQQRLLRFFTRCLNSSAAK